ncbi:FAD-dependent monooxygenase [Microbulbifer thermotolerans]|uniref:2-octaprenyl-3-methyl-6-methoxy-1,4-benzoquinol hydroxylase n=1 Tax=Microbulbifer thermotolerans TaxID=252514 RepID=A0A143HRA4_MICTH|nr:FAD-dependent monooxygenase [Microbulbifer thermotolerans]AMX04273.1 2-octaprenyl-3-methyl-6-methoxy-1,4-benzoquinol hydroxylase [Microbulbifer thermotolerans]
MTGANKQRVDVAIVGGGMAGASLALMLAHFCPHLSVALLEQRALPDADASVRLPSFDTRATAIAAGSLQLFSELGLWNQLRDYCAPIERIQVSDRGRPCGMSMRAAQQPRASFAGMLGAVVENAALGPVLHRALAQTQTQVLAPARVNRVRMVADGAQLDWSAGAGCPDTQLQAGLLVVADGADSPLCRGLGIVTERIEYRQRALVTTLGVQRDHRGTAYERFTDAGPMALLPLPRRDGSHRMALVWTCSEEDAAILRELPEHEFIARLQKRFGWRAGRIERAGRVSDYPLSLSLAREQWRRNLVLLGNCAHFLHPVAGQGFNLTLRDCYGLARALAGADLAQNSTVGLELLEAYGRDRRLDQQLTIGFSDRIPPLFASPGLFARGLRQAGLLALALTPPLRAGFVGQAAGFGL